jgi:hypothetical protein
MILINFCEKRFVTNLFSSNFYVWMWFLFFFDGPSSSQGQPFNITSLCICDYMLHRCARLSVPFSNALNEFRCCLRRCRISQVVHMTHAWKGDAPYFLVSPWVHMHCTRTGAASSCACYDKQRTKVNCKQIQQKMSIICLHLSMWSVFANKIWDITVRSEVVLTR